MEEMDKTHDLKQEGCFKTSSEKEIQVKIKNGAKKAKEQTESRNLQA
jgi:hypothetical protein